MEGSHQKQTPIQRLQQLYQFRPVQENKYMLIIN